MKGIYIMALCSLLLAGCAQQKATTAPPAAAPTSQAPASPSPGAVATTSAEGGLEVSLPGGQNLSFQPACGYFDPRGDIKSGTISVANYEFKMEPMAANSVAEIAQDGQVRVAVGLKSLPEGSYERPITPGEYLDSNISFVEVYSFEGGSQRNSGFDNEKGKVTVTEVTDSTISGTIDVQGDNGAVLKGAFNARTTQKP